MLTHMNTNTYPLLFKPVYKDYIWGGKQMRKLPGRSAGPAVRAESWEVSTRPEGMSIVANGALKGCPLQSLTKTQNIVPFKNKTDAPDFPLLVKIIDAASKLSIQVHPDDKTARTLGADPKTEAWHIVAAKPGACIYSLKPGTTKKALVSALNDGSAEKLMKRISVKRGQTYFIPAGTVHAIGAGCLIMEVQQNSNTTYRLFDWNRKDKEGKPRQLHISESLRAINWKNSLPVLERTKLISRNKTCSLYSIVLCKYFRMDRLVLKADTVLNQRKDSFTIIFNPSNDVVISSAGNKDVVIRKGSTCLIPAALNHCLIKPMKGSADLILTMLP